MADGAVELWTELFDAAKACDDAKWKVADPTALARLINGCCPPGIAFNVRTMAAWFTLGSVPLGAKAWDHNARSPQVTALLEGLRSVAVGVLGESAGVGWVARLDGTYTKVQRRGAGPSLPTDRLAAVCVPVGPSRRSRLGDINLAEQRWRQASVETGDQVPAYVNRHEDTRFDELISTAWKARSPWDRFVVVIGKPTTGKTRSLLEHLNSQLDHNCELLIPKPDVTLTSFTGAVKAADRDRRRRQVVLLDDLQDRLAWDRTTADGLTVLADIPGLIITITVHRQDLPQPDQRLTPTLQARMDENGLTETMRRRLWNRAVELRPTLDLAEIEAATNFTDQLQAHAHNTGTGVDPATFVHLGAQLTATDRLTRHWAEIHEDQKPPSPARRAVLDALLDRWILTRQPTTTEELYAFADLRYTHDNPGQPHLPSRQYDDAIDWLNRPSPRHTYSFNTAPIPDSYRLDDRLATTRLKSHTLIPQTETTPEEAFTAGNTFYAEGDQNAARIWWEAAASAGHINAMSKLGHLEQGSGDAKAARIWWKRAAAAGETTAMYCLGDLNVQAGKTDRARVWYQRAAAGGHLIALYNLGICAQQVGDTDTARTWYTLAAQAGITTAMYDLADLELLAGNFDTARTWHRRAADAGNTRDTQRTWWTRHASSGSASAMKSLGNFELQAGNTDSARTWYQRAINTGDAGAAYGLGLTEHQAGNLTLARLWYQRAADSGIGPAAFSHGNLEHIARNGDGARHWWARAAGSGHTDSMYNLGALEADAGNSEASRAWWTKAANAGHAGAMFILGNLEEAAGNPANARRWWTRASESGHPHACCSLAELVETDGDVAEAARLREVAAAAGVVCSRTLADRRVAQGSEVSGL